MRDDLTIDVPHFVSPLTLAASIRDLPIVAKGETLRAYFEPPERISLVTLNASRSTDGTAEGLCAVLAFKDWLVRNTPPTIQLKFSPPPASSVLDSAMDGVNVASCRVPDAWPGFVPVRVDIPGDPPPDGDRTRQDLFSSVSKCIQQKLCSMVDSPAAARLLDEFVIEGLLNVSQHAGGDGSLGRTAWISARRWSKNEAEVLAPTELWRGSAPWLERTLDAATGFLEIAIADAGPGVASGLVDAYLSRHPDVRSRLGRREEWWKVHDEVLSWAFSAFGSRKVHGSGSTFGRAWRGLYRVRFRAGQLGALFCLRSGLGMYGIAVAGGDSYELRLEALGEKGERRTMPWTLLTLLLPLPSLARVAPPEDEAPETAAPTRTVIVPANFQQLLHPGNSAEPGGREYAAKVRDLLRDVGPAGLLPSDATAAAVAVIHPFLRPETGVPQTEAIELHDEQVIAVEVLRWLEDSAMPGITPIHLFIDVPIHAIEEAQKYFAERDVDALGEPTPPEVFAICHPATNRLHWFVQIENKAEAATLAIERVLESSLGHPLPPWWLELTHFYPWFAAIEQESGSPACLRVIAPTRLSTDTTLQALQALIPAAAQSSPNGNAWFWQSPSVDAELIRTTSGRLVSQFVSVNALCLEEAVAETALSFAVRELLNRIGNGDIVRVITDTSSSSYLLAKRLLWNDPRVDVIHPDDAGVLSAGSVVIFADAVYAGRLILSRIADLPKHLSCSGIVAAFDLRPASVAATPLPQRLMSVVTWPFPEQINDPHPNADILEVDEITNEVLTKRLATEVRGYKSLLWQAPVREAHPTLTADEADCILRSDRFRYGFQWIGERLHVVKCSTRDLLHDESASLVITTWISRIVATALQGNDDSDVVVIARDASPFRTELPRLLEGVIAATRLSLPEWRGDLYGSTIETTRRRGRQILRHHLSSVVRTATPYAIAQRPVITQFQLFTDRQPRDGAILIYIDNGAVTGSAIRDVALSAADLVAPLPAALRILVMINKLAPSDERLLHQIDAMTRTRSAGLQLRFDALIQLRIPTFDMFEATAIARELEGLPAACRGVDIEEIQRWLDDVVSFVQKASDKTNDHAYQYPMGPTIAVPMTVSVRAIFFRHLMAIHQTGLPVIDALVENLHDISNADDRSITVVLALEPQLLDDSLLNGALADDIGRICLRMLTAGDITAGAKRNSLFVLFHLKSFFTAHGTEIAKAGLADDDLRGMIVGLALAQASGPFRDRLLRTLVEMGEALARQEEWTRRLESPLLHLRAAQRFPRRQRMLNHEGARAIVSSFVNTARAYHALSPWGAWWDLHKLLTEDLVPADERHDALQKVNWDLVFEFLRDELVPVVSALAHLRRRPTLPMHRVDDVIRNMSVAFEHVQRIACPSSGHTNLSDLRVAWQELQRRSLSAAVNVIYVRDHDTVVGAGTESGIIDTLLCAILQEPIGLLLHTFVGAFDATLPVTLVVSGLLERSKHAPIQEHLLWLSQVWLEKSTLPVIWEHSDSLRMCYHVFVDNVRRRGAVDPEVVIQVHFDGEQLELSIENRRRFGTTNAGPRGRGLRQAEDVTRRLNGVLIIDEAVTTFRVVHRTRAECLHLYREGE
jgi:hypothetical protein